MSKKNSSGTKKKNELWETIVFICVHISNVLLISKSYGIVEALLVFKIQNEILAKQCNSSPVLLSVCEYFPFSRTTGPILIKHGTQRP